MTQEIEGTQGMNPEISTEYEPMRPDDPHQPEGSEPIVDIDEETDAELAEAAAATKEALAKPVEERLGLTETGALLEEASDLVIEAIERRVEPMPYGSYLVHDEPPAHKGGPTRSPEELSHAGVLHVPVTDELLKWATAAGAAQEAVDAILGSARGFIYLALHGVDHEGYSQVLGARTTADSARALCQEHAGELADRLEKWKQLGSGTVIARVADHNEYYEVLVLTVYQ